MKSKYHSSVVLSQLLQPNIDRCQMRTMGGHLILVGIGNIISFWCLHSLKFNPWRSKPTWSQCVSQNLLRFGETRIKYWYSSCSSEDCILVLILYKGRLSGPNSMNFRKTSKQPLTPHPIFGKQCCAFCIKIFRGAATPPFFFTEKAQRNFSNRK